MGRLTVERGQNLEPDDQWTGPESLFRSAGFSVLRDDSRWPVFESVWQRLKSDNPFRTVTL
jgi:Golgi nucleoside diphosphatase